MIGAEILDQVASLILAIMLLAISLVVTVVIQLVSEFLAGILAAIALMITAIIYFAYEPILEYYWKGQTLGKKGANIRVVKMDGSKIGAREAFLRNLPIAGYLIPYAGLFMHLAALIGIVSSDKRQRLFDRVADTAVIKDRS